MSDLHIVATPSEPPGDLHGTAGVGGDDDAGAGALDVAQLRLQDLHAQIVVGDVVDPGAATALVRLDQLDQLEPGNRLE